MMPATLDPKMALHYLVGLFEFHGTEAETLDRRVRRAYLKGETRKMMRLQSRAMVHALTAAAAHQGMLALMEKHPELVN